MRENEGKRKRRGSFSLSKSFEQRGQGNQGREDKRELKSESMKEREREKASMKRSRGQEVPSFFKPSFFVPACFGFQIFFFVIA